MQKKLWIVLKIFSIILQVRKNFKKLWVDFIDYNQKQLEVNSLMLNHLFYKTKIK